MKRTILGSTFVPALLAALSLAGCAQGELVEETTAPCQSKEKSDIVDSASRARSFTMLARAIEAAGLSESLRGKGLFTVFAPTDAAFARLPRGAFQKLLLPENRESLRTLLLRHIAAGLIDSRHIAAMSAIPVLSGHPVAIGENQGEVTLDGVTVFHIDIIASSGVIHMIGAVILPERPVVNPEEPVTHPEEPVTHPEEPVTHPEEPVTNPQEPALIPQEPALAPQEPVSVPQEPALAPQEPVSVPEEPATPPEKKQASPKND